MKCKNKSIQFFAVQTYKSACVFLLVIVLLLIQLNSKAQVINTDYVISFKCVDIEEGLAAREAYTGVQDGKGFVWFGTRNGLNRFDGKSFQLFTKQSHNMQGNNIVKVASDLNNQLFVLYGLPGYSRWATGIVDVFNHNTLQFTTLTKTFPQLPFKESNVYWISNEGTDEITFLTKSPYQVWKYTSKKGFKLRLEMKEWDKENTFIYTDPSGPFTCFYKGNGYLGFGGHSTSYIINKNSTKQFATTNYSFIKAVSIKGNGSLLVKYSKNKFEGLGEFRNGQFSNIELANKTSFFKDILASNATIIPVASDTNSIIHIQGKGLFFYNNSNLIKVAEPSVIKDFATLNIYECFADRLGNTWVCSSAGIFKVRVRSNKFNHLFTKQQQKIETNNQVRGIFEDKFGNVCANVWNNFFMQKNGVLTSIKNNDFNYGLIEHNKTLYTTNYKLEELDSKTNQLKPLVASNSGRQILSALSLNDSIILLGKMENIFTYNTNSKILKLVKSYMTKPISPNMIYHFFKRFDGTIWAASETGLFLLNNQGDIIDCYGENANAKNILPVSNFTDVFEDAKGIVWITTNGYGLYKWDRKKNTATRFGIEDGLPTNAIYSILEDNEKKLWMGSENGLIYFNPVDSTVNVFYEKDGLSHNEFNRMSSFKAWDGKLFFGGMNGINSFYPNEIINDTASSAIPLQIISFHKFSNSNDKLQDLTSELLQNKKIILDPGDKFFSLEFRLLDYENKITRYAYKIEGQDKDWNYTKESSIRISGIPSGLYVLRIKAQTITGQWSSSELKFVVEVNAAFYNKPWFVLLMVVLFLLLGVFILSYRTKKLNKDKELLEAIIDNRTTQLKTTLAERELLLKEIHHRVKNNLQIISGLLDLQKEEIEEDKSKAVFNEGQSRVKSIALIHQNLYQNEDLANVKFSSFVQEMAVQVGEVFEHLDSKMLIKINMPDLVLDIDTAVPLGLIINELLTNSFKYASVKNKTGSINIEMIERAKGNYILIFSDNGPGIDAAINFDTAITLGLRLIKGLAAQLYGEAIYHFDNGSIFTITFKDTVTRKMED